jgi:RNA 2',3'-cyclic 3'-phosphodiesterase
MRLFTGLDLPPAVKDNLDDLVRRLRPTADIRWSPVENLHVTTKFIGEWPEERLEQLKGVLAGVPRRDPLEISVGCLGYFPAPHRPRVFWAGVQGGPPLRELARDTEQALVGLGIAAEDRPYSPHLTLARIQDPRRALSLRQAVAPMVSSTFGQFTADRFSLYLSRPGPKGSTYTKLAEFPFRKEAPSDS